MTFETLLFDIAPWTREIMHAAKNYPNSKFLLERSGWVDRGIKPAETIYEHTCKLTLAAYYLFGTWESVDISISHDFPKIIVRDYIPKEITTEKKKRLEEDAMQILKTGLPNGEYWYENWKKYSEKKGIGRVISQLDKICPCIQAIEYGRRYKNHNLEEFPQKAKEKIEIPELVEILDIICGIEISLDINPYDVYFEMLRELHYNNQLL